MFEDQDLSHTVNTNDKLYFITNRRNLISFFGAGMLTPANSQFRYKKDSRDIFNGSIPFWKGGLPQDKKYFTNIEVKDLVLVEANQNDIMKYGSRFLVADDAKVIAVNAPVPLWGCVSKIYFADQSNIEDFILRLPKEIPIDPKILSVKPIIPSIKVDGIEKLTDTEKIENKLNFIDSFSGSIRALECFLSNKSTKYNFISGFLSILLEQIGQVYIEGANKTAKKNEVIVGPVKSLIYQLISILRDVKIENRIDPNSVFSLLTNSLSDEVKKDTEIINWIDYVERTLKSEIEVNKNMFSNDGNIYLRGVLLFLLRPSIERLEKTVNSSLSPSGEVLSVAAILCGFMTGLERLDSNYKFDGDYRKFNRFTRSMLDSLWCKSDYSIREVTERTNNSLLYIYELNNELLTKVTASQNIILARILTKARHLQYELTYDYENDTLSYEFLFENGRKQKIYIEVIEPIAVGHEVIRFISPCMDLSGSKARRLTKDVAIDFLKRNCEDSTYCSFAISKEREAIVVEATQIVSTMDDDEFKHLIKHVASVADDYEKVVLKKDVF